MKKAKALLLNTVILTATSLLTNTLSISFNVYISNKIGAAAMGVYQLLMSVFMLALTLAVSGIGLASTRLVAEELAEGNESGAKKAVRNCMVYAFSFGLLAAVLLIANAEAIALNWIHDKITIRPLYILAVSLPFISMSAVLSGYFSAVRRVAKSAATQIFERFIRMYITICIMNLILPEGLETAYIAIVLGTALSEILSFFCIFILYLLDKRRYKSTKSGKNLRSRMLNISVPVALSAYVRSALSTIKQIMIPIYLEKSGVSCNTALAEYGMINGMVLPVIMYPSCIFNSLSTLLVPEITRLYVTKNYSRIDHLISRIFKITLLASLCIGGILFSFADELSFVLYKSTDVSMYIKIFSLIIPVMYFDTIADGLLIGLNGQVSVVRISIIDTATTIVLIYCLLPVFGINGYVAVIFLSEILNAFLSVRKLIKVTSCNIKFFDWIAKPALAIITAAMMVSLLPSINLAAGIILTVVIYLAILYVLGSIKREDFLLYT